MAADLSGKETTVRVRERRAGKGEKPNLCEILDTARTPGRSV